MVNEAHERENDPDHREDLSDIRRVVGETAESEDRGNDGDDKEGDCPGEHS